MYLQNSEKDTSPLEISILETIFSNMAPSAITETTQAQPKKEVVSYDINLPYKPISDAEKDRAKGRTEYPEYLPTWDEMWFEDCPEFEFNDPGLRADKNKPNLLQAGVKMHDITPKMGTVLTGVKLEELNNEAKDELALLVSERKIIVLRDQQGFLETGPGFQQDFM